MPVFDEENHWKYLLIPKTRGEALGTEDITCDMAISPMTSCLDKRFNSLWWGCVRGGGGVTQLGCKPKVTSLQGFVPAASQNVTRCHSEPLVDRCRRDVIELGRWAARTLLPSLDTR